MFTGQIAYDRLLVKIFSLLTADNVLWFNVSIVWHTGNGRKCLTVCANYHVGCYMYYLTAGGLQNRSDDRQCSYCMLCVSFMQCTAVSLWSVYNTVRSDDRQSYLLHAESMCYMTGLCQQ